MAISLMMGIVINRIWKKLKLNPSLQRNERIMWALLTICISYGFLYLLSAISFNLQANDESNQNFVTLRQTVSTLRGIFQALSDIIILYMCQKFVNIERRTSSVSNNLSRDSLNQTVFSSLIDDLEEN